MRRSDLADLTAFVAVAEHLSFRAAATRLGVTPSALSHTIRQLEERLGVRLLNRTTRSVSLTDAGLRLLERLRPAIDQIGGALRDLDQERQRPFGRLRINVAPIAAGAVIAPVWARFLMTYPEVQLEVWEDPRPIDIVAERFDAGIALRERVAADMIAVRVTGPLKLAVVAAPIYLARRRAPRTPDDLARHSCIQFRVAVNGPIVEWPFQIKGRSRRIAVKGPVIVNSIPLILRAAVDGLGIALTAEADAKPFLSSGQLVSVLENWTPSLEGLFLYYSGRRQVPGALRAFIDMVGAAGKPKSGRALKNPFAEGVKGAG
jgi:DNA-binding transcriptional LysR family regulator